MNRIHTSAGPIGRRFGDDTGSAGFSSLIVILSFFMLIGLGVAGMRVFTGASDLQSAAQSAARAAALEHEPGAASGAANTVAQSEIQRAGAACEGMTVNVDTSRFEPGGVVVVNLSCFVSYQGLYMPFAGRQVNVSATEPIDCLRGGGSTELDDNCYYGG